MSEPEIAVPDEPAPKRSGAARIRRTVVNGIGFAVGLGLFIWIVVVAVRDGDWGRLRDASAWQISGLVVPTIVSCLVNGAMFWVTIRPIKHLRMYDLQWLHVVSSLLNYAPLRLGAIARAAYHLRVDRITMLDQGNILTIGTVDELRNSENERIQRLLNRRFEEEVLDAEAYLARLTGEGPRD